ncbi:MULTISPECIES: hypothetical protein [Leuconostoc]|jgi:hypothetical protein|uniref:Uncharacterized protein n=1 Tax=Leuconostoc mesenteroides subsp. mesenteroides (strain ATCC 8293 / DSM 20343 / BCRC 11652 / CCM 1803 / JCM 6124 / NCDO 523 / NBRC 100496 / NCIMB 8023 / NCTC 12954 / NRRL B-1118 / 37Y) TaxID=203120 RepID=Q03VL9_LEUMM|nr:MULTISPECIES: hypothetical protein [Leuconostoc]ABJ62753.1 hypothetical protein LEUM_1661 [Leuconostoc mesenteroides subsp. mesenteroides ATCC 8293]AHF19656.1 hypothetical protein LMES_1440 [Leuconostoc mesenteroides KFRI-MG]KAA8366301.1 hypothetical protein FE417_09345 [Leuconostoc mesenteroides]MBA5972520.1 hypothetical protein [Leuconostoc mesenteroides]MCJ2160462.1 hypothetical protein [Leuconostoc mesenteroides]
MSKKEITLSQVVTWFLTIIAVVISAFSGIYQWNQSKRYSDNTNKILINSAKLAEYDLDLMIYKIDNGGDETLDYGQFRFQLDSLQQNFETIEAINPTSLSKNQAMNYQVYRQNLNAVIYKATSYVNALRVNQTETPKDTDKLHVDLGARQNFYQGVGSSLNVIKSDLKVLENNKSLYDQDYKKNSKILEEQK